MEQLLNDAVAISDGLGGKIVGMLSALIVTIMTVVKVVKWAAQRGETQISDLANLILAELNRPIERINVKNPHTVQYREIVTPEGVKVKADSYIFLPSYVDCWFKDELVNHRLTRKERKLIKQHYWTAISRKLAAIKAEQEQIFQSKVTAALCNVVKAEKS